MVILAHFAVTNDLHEKNDSFCPKMAISEIFRPKKVVSALFQVKMAFLLIQ